MMVVAQQCRNELGENSFLLFLPGRKIMSRMSLQAVRDLKGGHSTLELSSSESPREGKEQQYMPLLRSIELKVLPSDARETEEDVGQVTAARAEKITQGCCVGSAWTPVIDLMLSPAPLQTLVYSEPPEKTMSFWQHKLLCYCLVKQMEQLKPFAPPSSA